MFVRNTAMHSLGPVFETDTPEGLFPIHRSDCAVAIWRRNPLPSFLSWINGLTPEQLPKALLKLSPENLREAMLHKCKKYGTPNCSERDRLIDDTAALAKVFSSIFMHRASKSASISSTQMSVKNSTLMQLCLVLFVLIEVQMRNMVSQQKGETIKIFSPYRSGLQSCFVISFCKSCQSSAYSPLRPCLKVLKKHTLYLSLPPLALEIKSYIKKIYISTKLKRKYKDEDTCRYRMGAEPTTRNRIA